MLAALIPNYVEFIPEQDKLEEGTLYISKRFGTAIHLCCCGCKQQTVTPLTTSGWQLTEQNNTVTLRPSIGNWRFPCRSHYYLTNNNVEWL